MAIEFGRPLWTEGGFTRVAAQDDLGLESVGAALLRRLLPGIVQTTPNAGYYSYYPYLLARWEDTYSSIKRPDFKPWYRRQEAAYAIACLLHDHRDDANLRGINGSDGANRVLRSLGTDEQVPVGHMAEPGGYMQSPYGGYGLFYARVLADMRLTRLGVPGQVDKVTELGREVTERFGESFESTEYFDRWFDAPDVPLGVLAELGDATCLCTIPGRPDHAALLDAFIRHRDNDPDWAARRDTRVESLALFLSFHAQRPGANETNLGMFQRALLMGRFVDGSDWARPSMERWNSWRAYQLRETEVLALGSLWTSLLLELGEIGPIGQADLRDHLVMGIRWAAAEFAPDIVLADAVERTRSSIPNSEGLIDVAERLQDVRGVERGEAVAMAIAVLLRVRSIIDERAAGFDELLDEGGSWRWSLRHLAAWLDHRSDRTLDVVVGDIFDALLDQHRRVALSKVGVLDSRDPFCVAEDDGLLSLVRSDEPFWTAARYGVLNHLLWTLGVLTSPDDDPRPTPLGSSMLGEMSDA